MNIDSILYWKWKEKLRGEFVKKSLKYFELVDWQIGGGEGNGFKSVTAFYPSEASNSNGIFTYNM